MIKLLKVPGFVALVPMDKEGGHNIAQIMATPRIPDHRKQFNKDRLLIADRDIFVLDKILKEYGFSIEIDDSLKQFVKQIKESRNAPPATKKIRLDVGVVKTKITGTSIPVEEIKKATRFFLKAAVNTPKYKDIGEDGKRKWDGYIHLFNLRTKQFPTGLLPAVVKILQKKKLEYEIHYLYDQNPPKQFDWYADWGNIVLDPDQIEAIEAAIKYKRGIIKAPTGFGKTAIFARGVIAALGVPTLFIANKKQLLDDARDDFNAGIAGADCIAIKDGWFGDVKVTPQMDTEDAKSALSAPIIVATIQSLDARMKDPRTGPTLLYWMQNICKLVIVDESQAVGTKVWDEVLDEVGAPYRIFLSATPRRTDGASIKLVAGSGPAIFTTTAEEQIEKGRLCDLDIVYNTFDHKLFNERDKDIVYAEAYRACILENEKRNRQVIINPAIDMIREGRHVLILIQYIEHGHILKNMLVEAGVELDNIRFVWGDTPNKLRQSAIAEFRKGDFQVMIGSTIFDAGVNIPVISGVVLAGAGNSDITLIQRIGRGARNCEYEDVLGYLPDFMKEADGKKVTKVFDVMDVNAKFFAKQARNRYNNACKEFGVDRVHVVGTSERPPSKLSRETVDGIAAAAAKFKMMMEMGEK